MKKSILFVDDEQSVLQGLKRSLRGQRKEWDMVFSNDGKEALNLANEIKFDAIVTDMRMPEMDGAQLLEILATDHPESIRIILSGHSDEAMILRSTETAHQFLTKPCDAATLKDTLIRAFELKNFLGDGKLQSLMNGLMHLPSLPQAYLEITNKLSSSKVSVQEIGETISTDPAMTAKILQMVNSAFFGLGRHVSDTKEAVTLLGLDTLKALVFTVGVFSQFDKNRNKDNDFSIDALLNHSLAVARLAERIAQAEGVGKAMSDDCFLAGILHHIGLLILEQNRSEDYAKVRSLVREQGMTPGLAEHEIFGATQEAIGAYLLGLWALPDRVVEAVAFHHHPALSHCQQFSPLTAVHVADALVGRSKLCEGVFPSDAMDVDHEFLSQAGLSDRLETWIKLQDEETEA